jgi:hypothetical protein
MANGSQSKFMPSPDSTGSVLRFRNSGNSPYFGASGVWDGFDALAAAMDPFYCHQFFDDFHSLATAADTWIETAASSGTIVAGVKAGGVATFDSGAITDGQGPQQQLAGVDFFPAAGKTIWFECRVNPLVFITGDYFFGLAELDTTVVASSDMSTSNHIGFQSFTGDGVLLANAAKAGTAVTPFSVGYTLTAATYVRLGFVVNGVTSVTYYVNGTAVATTVATANIPIVGLTPTFVLHATGTDQALMDVDYVKVAQLR